MRTVSNQSHRGDSCSVSTPPESSTRRISATESPHWQLFSQVSNRGKSWIRESKLARRVKWIWIHRSENVESWASCSLLNRRMKPRLLFDMFFAALDNDLGYLNLTEITRTRQTYERSKQLFFWHWSLTHAHEQSFLAERHLINRLRTLNRFLGNDQREIFSAFPFDYTGCFGR